MDKNNADNLVSFDFKNWKQTKLFLEELPPKLMLEIVL